MNSSDNGVCECGMPLADGGIVGLYCSNKTCPVEAALVRQMLDTFEERRTARDQASPLQTAIKLAIRAHTGQKDKGGFPYILHPLRVMVAVPLGDEESQIAAVLHDVVEDCSISVKYIEYLFGAEIAEIVDALSRREGETYANFILRCKASPKARAIKILDIQDNMRPDRAGQLGDKEREGMAKRYMRALAVLADVQVSDDFGWYQGQVDRGIVSEIVRLKRAGKL